MPLIIYGLKGEHAQMRVHTHKRMHMHSRMKVNVPGLKSKKTSPTSYLCMS